MPVTYRIHPAIGIARVGDSVDDFFVGPEAPGVPPTLNRPDGSSARPGQYKDEHHRIKRQGARFRIYAYTQDDAGTVSDVREITDIDGLIEWEVHLVNGKAAAQKLDDAGPRNGKTAERDLLIIDPGPHRISGANQGPTELRGTFMKTMDVHLGDLLTDGAGRLVVLGGHGQSQSVPGTPLVDFADNDGWCDDTADGPVRATLRLNGESASVAVDPAWLIVAPPDFAPPIENVVTLYDAVYDVMARFDPRLAVTDSTTISFTRDVYPILRRVSDLHWVSGFVATRHGPGQSQHFISRLDELSSNTPENEPARGDIFRALRSPRTGLGRMPKVPRLALENKVPGTTITETQYRRMERWALGTFDADWPGTEPAPTPLEDLPEADRPHALDRAALEACVGGPFYPGIEASRCMVDEATYDRTRLFRLNPGLPPGTVTAPMAVPWQADFNDCSIENGADWWPGQRPNQVARGAERHAEWVPPAWSEAGRDPRRAMVDNWAQLGFVVARNVDGNVVHEEDERFFTP